MAELNNPPTAVITTILANDDFVRVLDGLPTSLKTIAELSGRFGSADIDLDDLSETIRCDPVLAADVLRAANSPGYVGDAPLDSIEQVMVRFGQDETFRLVAAASAAHLISEDLGFYGISAEQMLFGTLFEALVMEALASQAQTDPRVALATGLARPIGKIVLHRNVSQTACVAADLSNVHALADWETEMIGYANHELAAEILAAWEFPAASADAIRQHYMPSLGASRLALLVNVAAGAAYKCGHGFAAEESYWEFLPAHLAALDIAESTLTSAMAYAERESRRLLAALDRD